MSTNSSPYTPEILSELRELVKDCPSWLDAKALLENRLKITPDNVTRLNRRYGIWGGGNGSVVATKTLSDGFETEVETSKAATLEEVIAMCKVDSSEWESKGFSVRRGSKGFAWNARFAKRKEAEMGRKLADDLKADMMSYSPSYKEPKRTTVSGEGKLLVVSLFDAHLGKLSWAEQDGQNYDLKIAKELYMKALYDLVDKAKQQGGYIAKVLFPIGNDYLTCDGSDNETSAGTPQSVDGRFPKIFREARKMLVEAIDYLREIAPVDIVVIGGNHERESMFHMGDALECWYHADDSVTIDNQFSVRKYYSFGETVFGFSHGDTINQEKLPLLGAYERPDLWARCKRRVWLLGHHHHYQLKEYVGVQVWILPSLSGSDVFHQANGFVGASRCAVAFLHGANGLEAMFQSEVEN